MISRLPRTVQLVSLLLSTLAFSTLGCASPVDDDRPTDGASTEGSSGRAAVATKSASHATASREDEPSSTRSHEHWLASTWTSRRLSTSQDVVRMPLELPTQMTTSEQYVLESDGTGFLHRTWGPGHVAAIPGAEHEVDRRVHWASDGQNLFIDGEEHELAVTPNCRLLQIGERVFERATPTVSCPLHAPALGLHEAPFAGTWRAHEARRGPDEADAEATLQLDDDRHAYVHVQPHRAGDSRWLPAIDEVAYVSIDSEGMLRGTLPDGSEALSLQVERIGADLRVCSGSSCLRMLRADVGR